MKTNMEQEGLHFNAERNMSRAIPKKPQIARSDCEEESMIPKPRVVLLFVAVSVLSGVWAFEAFSAETADKPTRIRMGLAARSTTSMPFFVAKERGFFREEGLDVELIVMQAIQTIQATMGTSLQFGSATGSAVSAAVNGADIKVILAVTDRPSFDLIAQPSITSVQQLRGKKIGTGGAGSFAGILSPP